MFLYCLLVSLQIKCSSLPIQGFVCVFLCFFPPIYKLMLFLLPKEFECQAKFAKSRRRQGRRRNKEVFGLPDQMVPDKLSSCNHYINVHKWNRDSGNCTRLLLLCHMPVPSAQLLELCCSLSFCLFLCPLDPSTLLYSDCMVVTLKAEN